MLSTGRISRVILARRHPHSRQSLDVAQKRLFILIAKGDGHARRPSPRRSADAMHVSLRHVGKVVVEYVGNLVDVNPPSRDVAGDKHRQFARAEADLLP
jgi:hypothetical protein